MRWKALCRQPAANAWANIVRHQIRVNLYRFHPYMAEDIPTGFARISMTARLARARSLAIYPLAEHDM